MSKYKLEKGLDGNGKSPSVGERVTHQESRFPVLYRCSCPECGARDMEVIDFESFSRSPALCVTGEGEIGCGEIELDGDCNLVVECQECSHQLPGYLSTSTEVLIDLARARMDELTPLPFICPCCKSNRLSQIEIGAEFHREVVAVYTVSNEGESTGEPVVALSFDRNLCRYGPCRYRCSNGHELANDDGSPVETSAELVEWLKARGAADTE